MTVTDLALGQFMLYELLQLLAVKARACSYHYQPLSAVTLLSLPTVTILSGFDNTVDYFRDYCTL